MVNLLSPEILGSIVAAVLLLERLAKLIPDTATGILGTIRKVSKFLSLYVPNNTGPQKVIVLPDPPIPPSGGGNDDGGGG